MMLSTSMKLLVLVLYASSTAVNALQTYGLQQLCNNQSTGNITLKNPDSGILSSAILVASTSYIYNSTRNCSVIIQSEDNVNGIIISVVKINLRLGDVDTLMIQYVNESDIEREKIYRNSTPYSEDESYHSISNVTVTLDTGSDLLSNPDGFELTVTTVSDANGTDTFKCRNGLYIAKELICDGYNHCGDRSDQENCNVDTTDYDTRNAIVMSSVVSGIVVVLAILSYCVCSGKCEGRTSRSSGSRSSVTYGLMADSENAPTSSNKGRSAGYTSSTSKSGGSAASSYSSSGGAYSAGAGKC